MTTVAGWNATDNVSVEARGRLLFEARQYWIEGDTGHVEDDGYVFAVPIRETGPVVIAPSLRNGAHALMRSAF